MTIGFEAATTAMVEATGTLVVTKEQLLAWAVGTIDGGPNGDGNYPFTAADGTTVLVPSAAKLEVLHGDPSAVTAALDGALADIAVVQADVAAAATQAQDAAGVLQDVFQNVAFSDAHPLVRAVGGVVTEIIPASGPRVYPVAPLSRSSIEGFSQDQIPGVANVSATKDGVVLSMQMIDGRRVSVVKDASGLPEGGGTGDVLVRDNDAADRSRWESVTSLISGLMSPLLNSIRKIIPTAKPPTLTGYTAGNLAVFPQAVLGKGMSVDKFALGAVRSDGAQMGLIFSRVTGDLLSEYVVRSGFAEDDHNPTSPQCYDDGTFVFLASGGHNDSATAALATYSNTGGWSKVSLQYSNTTCYPGSFIDRNAKLWLFMRVNNVSWAIRTVDQQGATPSAERIFVAADIQLYSHQRYDAENHCFHLFVRPNSGHPSFGNLRRLRLDCATGEFFDANGGLGKLDGTASSNGKTLPIDWSTVPVFAAHPAGMRYSVVSYANDGRDLIVSVTDDATDGETLSYWHLKDGGNRFVLADYARYENIVDTGGTFGNFTYSSGHHIAEEPHPGFRFYVGIVDDRYRLEQWDCPSGDGAAWITSVIAEAEPGELLVRPFCFQEANDDTPLASAGFTTFDSYDAYTGETIRFFKRTA